ncbi:DNA-binding transcriptional regulator AraC [Saccharicrinis fermentans DSM 9555 = JCM 21142]|uniref:DNA-binding transcriptional regulator AraC n=2 Tax=Saccharicrinis fermentans TaxID=982 RepID=W7YPI8_9BACT|nr:DNA-binding transcriptional regulator AraC [Saccharicrinis fermentans DSM 9555 = JCM 21142]
MKIYENIKGYFLNTNPEVNDYSNQFYIRSIKEDRLENKKPDEIYIEPHKRDFFEIAVLLQNTKNIQIGDQTLPVMERSLAVVSPFQTIRYEKKTPNDEDEGYVICFKASLFHHFNQPYAVQNEFPFFKIHTLPLYHLSKDDFNEILSIIEEIFRESRGNKTHSFEVVRSLLLIALYKIKRLTQGDEGIVTMNRFDAVMSKFEYEILSGKDGFLSVNEYASKLNISPIYLSECVKSSTGKSAQKIIIDYKILYAQTLLHQMEKSISEIADILGFNEVSNFNQFFKRHTGITASQFRKKKD